jgi:hypothetical protein
VRTPGSAPEAPGVDAALRVARRALARLPAYREVVRAHGVSPRRLGDLSGLPYLDKRTVFEGDIRGWIDGGSLPAAAELLTSSGQSGAFSVGMTSAAEALQATRMADHALRALGADEDSPTLLLNCLPMGIGVQTTLATVASPSVHLGMALELVDRVAAGFDRLVILAEPLFLKELAEAAIVAKGPGWAPPETFVFVGGEWVAEAWRTYVSGLMGLPDPATSPGPGVLISMGAAEIGLHSFVETPALRAARRALGDPAARHALFGRDPGYSPTFLTYDPERLHVEQRPHPDGWRTLVVTTLTDRLMPLVRYDLGDLVDLVPASAVNAELEARDAGVEVEGPVVALWGRAGEVSGPGWSLRPEPVKERIFASAAPAASLSGRFYLEVRDGEPWLHLQLRAGAGAAPAMVDDLRAYLHRVCGGGEVVLHDLAGYPHHLAGDHQHKPRYHAVSR